MIAYYIKYKIRNNDKLYEISINARDLKSVKNKIGKKHGYKTGNMIQIQKADFIGYF